MNIAVNMNFHIRDYMHISQVGVVLCDLMLSPRERLILNVWLQVKFP